MILKRRASLGALATLAVGSLVAATQFLPAAADADSEACLAAGNVWVTVQTDSGTDGGCATQFGTGFEALTSAGFAYEAPDGFITSIDGVAATDGRWWSYWSDAGDGWVTYETGAAESAPKAGTAEGWRLAPPWSEDAPPAPAPTFSAFPAPSASESTEESPSVEASPSVTETGSPEASPSSTPVSDPGLPHTGN